MSADQEAPRYVGSIPKDLLQEFNEGPLDDAHTRQAREAVEQ